MNKKQIEKLKEIIREREQDYDFNDYLENYIDEQELQEIEDIDQLREHLEELNQDGEITDTEIIYYRNAIKYLQEHDPSLKESITIAQDYGYDTASINSELLASLLQTQNNREEYIEFIEEIISHMEEVIK